MYIFIYPSDIKSKNLYNEGVFDYVQETDDAAYQEFLKKKAKISVPIYKIIVKDEQHLRDISVTLWKAENV